MFIYRSGATKSGRTYIRIYDDKTKKDFVQNLRTTNRVEAPAKAEEIYAEKKKSLRRGVKFKSNTTKEPIRLYTTLLERVHLLRIVDGNNNLADIIDP